MNEEMHFDEAKERLESIVAEVRKKDTSLERSIELLEEGVRLANVCVERIDETYASEAAEGDMAVTAAEEDGDGTVTDAAR
jgi:exodeoxyribonuclease VII small subunit